MISIKDCGSIGGLQFYLNNLPSFDFLYLDYDSIRVCGRTRVLIQF
jgi:hypothetical protein